MATVTVPKKACSVNPLKMSAPLGASYAFLGIGQCLPLMHGAQGCTSFGLVLLVRHFKETIPLQTTAMNEVTTILGGLENIEQALVNIHKRAKPQVLGLCSTGLTETKGDDVLGHLKLIRQAHPELADMEVVYVSTPDYVGAFEDGYAKAVEAMLRQLARSSPERLEGQVNVLAGCHLTAADIEELRELIESFGLEPIIVPDVSGSLDGYIPETFLPTTLGGTSLADIRRMGASAHTLVIGEHLSAAGAALHEVTGVPCTVLPSITGLATTDALVESLMTLSRMPVAPSIRRQRSQLQDVMLDAHFHLGGKKIAIAAEPDLLAATAHLLAGMGAQIAVAVTTTQSPLLADLPCDEVLVSDLDDFEQRAQAAGCELLITHSHGRQAAARTGIPLFRLGIPQFDRIGNQHRLSAGYRGTRTLLIELANLFLDHVPHYSPDHWPLPATTLAAVRGEGGCGSCSGACSSHPAAEPATA